MLAEKAHGNRVFISHSNTSNDMALVDVLCAALQRAGFEPIVGERVSGPMSHVGDKVRGLIESCGYFVGLVTQEGQDSQWVQQELGFAYQHHLRDMVLAVLVEEGKSPGGFYVGLEFFSFDDSSFEKNADAIASYFSQLQTGEPRLNLTAQRDSELRNMIDRVRADVKSAAVSQLMRAMEPMLDSLVTELSTAFQDPERGIMTRCGLDNFSMRTETFAALMDNLRAELNDAPLARALYRAGMEAGRSFGSDFCEQVLLKNRAAVISYADLLGFWLYYDQTSGWGRPSLTQVFPEIVIAVKNSFLVRQSARHLPHRYCSFLSGYFDGFLQFTLRRASRYAREARVVFDDMTIYSPREVKHEPRVDYECAFRISIAEEDASLKPAFDHLFKAGIASTLGDGLRCVNHCRAAMEFAVKGKLGRKEGDHSSFHEMVRTLFDTSGKGPEMAQLFESPKHYREVYGQLSATIHQLIDPSPEECRKTILAVDAFLCALERVVPGAVPSPSPS